MSSPQTQSRFHRFALGVLAYNVLVILWGAYVRATGSGAGCGSHWPLCNGSVLPRAERIQTAIEFIHRSSSGLCLVFVVALVVWARQAFPKGALARRAAYFSLGFTLSEALLGAMLVLLGHVEANQSVGRAISISLHLVNTLTLLATLTLTARWSGPKRQLPNFPLHSRTKTWTIIGLGLTCLLGMTGALTALGDTLFKATSLAAGMQQDFAEGSHFLLRLRVVHPVLAIVTAIVLLAYSEYCQRVSGDSASTRQWARALRFFVITQLMVGAANLALMAPNWMQLLHLFMADAIWISGVAMAAATFEAVPAQAPRSIIGTENHLGIGV